jgi:hypothetical protein
VSKQKQKGTAWETAVVKWLRDRGFNVERRALHGTNDRGDIAGIEGVVVECKNAKTYKLAEWIEETKAERDNDNAQFGVLLVKRTGKTDPGEGYWIMTAVDGAELLRRAGFGNG